MSNWTITTRKPIKDNPNHHLWLNRKTWWIVLTMYNKDTHQTTRHRQSLRTGDLIIAKKRRDKVLASLYAKFGKEEK